MSVAAAPRVEVPDLMVYAMAREISDHDTVLHGVASPLPVLAMAVARRTHAPGMAYVSGAEGVDPQLDRIYPSSFDPRHTRGCVAYFGLHEAFDLAQRGELHVMFLGAAQIDRHGNTNLSVIGDPERPTVQLPGGAATAFLMPITPRVVIWVSRHSPRTFVEKVDFVTGQGYDNRTAEQRKNRLKVITNLAVLSFDNDERVMQVDTVHPGVSVEDVERQTGFPLARAAGGVGTTPVPGPEVLAMIEALDPERLRWSEFARR
jgi:glutaconate CoA-transferase subunit B